LIAAAKQGFGESREYKKSAVFVSRGLSGDRLGHLLLLPKSERADDGRYNQRAVRRQGDAAQGQDRTLQTAVDQSGEAGKEKTVDRNVG